MSGERTHGPWICSPLVAQVEDPNLDPICKLLWPTDLRSEEETHGNAHLISAAPDYYDAVELAVGTAVRCDEGLWLSEKAGVWISAEAFDALVAAQAKAEGLS